MNLNTRIYLIGMMGCGKSFWGHAISKSIHYRYLDLDKMLIEKESRSINQIFEESGETYFRNLETELLKQSFITDQEIVMATGGGVPCFNNNMEAMNDHGITIWLNEPEDVLYQRLAKERSHRPLLRNLSDEELKDFIHTKLTERIPFYSKAKWEVTGKDLTETFIHQLIQDTI